MFDKTLNCFILKLHLFRCLAGFRERLRFCVSPFQHSVAFHTDSNLGGVVLERTSVWRFSWKNRLISRPLKAFKSDKKEIWAKYETGFSLSFFLFFFFFFFFFVLSESSFWKLEVSSYFKVGLSPPKNLKSLESPLKMMNNVFYFILNTYCPISHEVKTIRQGNLVN